LRALIGKSSFTFACRDRFRVIVRNEAYIVNPTRLRGTGPTARRAAWPPGIA
jgi:hypothetical protein